MRTQRQPVSPPAPSDIPGLIDFSSIIQNNLQDLYSAAHTHLGTNGVLSSFPVSNQGMAGDILIGLIAGTAYLFIKIDQTNWYKVVLTHV